jgi:hypothetical protein
MNIIYLKVVQTITKATERGLIAWKTAVDRNGYEGTPAGGGSIFISCGYSDGMATNDSITINIPDGLESHFINFSRKDQELQNFQDMIFTVQDATRPQGYSHRLLSNLCEMRRTGMPDIPQGPDE